MRIVVITAITADRDTLKERQTTAGADFVAFSDRPLRSATWEVRTCCDIFRDPARNAKVHKLLPQLFLPGYDYSLWIDGAVELTEAAPLLVERYLDGCDVVFARHGTHRSLAGEVDHCVSESRDDPALIAAQVASYGNVGHEAELPLPAVILRRHTPAVAHFDASWWSETCRWSRRDMLSVLPALRAGGVRWGWFPRDAESDGEPARRVLGSSHFRWYPHGVGVETATMAAESSPGDLPAWRLARLAFLEAVCGAREAYAWSLEQELIAHTRRAAEAESYARSLEEELAAHTRRAVEAESYARSLELELAAERYAGRREDGDADVGATAAIPERTVA